MQKRFRHKGMELTEEEHARWHEEHGDMIPGKHRAFME